MRASVTTNRNVTLEPPNHNGHGNPPAGVDNQDGGGSSRLLRWSLLAALVVLIGLWAYALVYSVTRRDPERLTASERSSLQDSCQRAARRMGDLPPLSAPPTNATVSARATAETDVLRRMVTDIAAVQPQRHDARTALRAWLDDWGTLFGARDQYAREVLRDKQAELVIPVDAGSPLYVRMDKYAASKGLEDCQTEPLGATNIYAFRKD